MENGERKREKEREEVKEDTEEEEEEEEEEKKNGEEGEDMDKGERELEKMKKIEFMIRRCRYSDEEGENHDERSTRLDLPDGHSSKLLSVLSVPKLALCVRQMRQLHLSERPLHCKGP